MNAKDRAEAAKWLRLGYETYGADGVASLAGAMGLSPQDGVAFAYDIDVGGNAIAVSNPASTATSGSVMLPSSEWSSSDYMFRYGSPPPTKRSPLSCPPAPPRGDRKWKAYDGDPDWFHCGFEGYIENRKPSASWPAGECFYDEFGGLVDHAHLYSGCAGTPNQYEADDLRHVWPDDGGVVKQGLGGLWESQRHLADRVRNFRRGQPRPNLKDVRPFRAPYPQSID